MTTKPAFSGTEQLYDGVGSAYQFAFAGLSPQLASIEYLKHKLPQDSKILDIGCATGKPVCYELAKAGYDVTGIDISGQMIKTAKAQVPNAHFEHIDLQKYKPDTQFDAITVYFSLCGAISHEEIRQSLRRIHTWLKPNGLFVYATASFDGEQQEATWLGRPVIASGFTAEQSVQEVIKAGFEVTFQEVSKFTPKGVEAGLCKEGEVAEETHLFVYAKKK